jgi:hypothetical protein
MSRSLRRPLARLLVAVLALGALAVVPSAAQATTVRTGSLELLPHASWINYLTRFGGSITATGSGSLSSNVLTTPLTATGTTYAPLLTNPITQVRSGSGALQFSGGIHYQLSAHFINLKLSDFRLVAASTTDTSADLYATVEYDPYETSGPQVTALVNYGVLHIADANLSGTFAGSVSGGVITHAWANAPLALTSDGALAFNGGTNGSYRAGAAFGSINARATT